MNKHEFDNERIQDAIRELRHESVPDEGRIRTFDAMVGQRIGTKRLPTIATAGAIAVGFAVLFWPGRSAMAWQQVVKTTLSNARLHHADFQRNPNGDGWMKSAEEWIDGAKNADRYDFPAGKDNQRIVGDARFDGKRQYRLSWTGYGVVYDSPRRRKPMFDRSARFNLQGLLADPRLKIDKTPKEVTLDGQTVLCYSARAYEGPVELGYSYQIAFYAEKEGGRIVRTEYLGQKGEVSEYSTVDYPKSISAEVFMPPTSGLRVFDLDRDAKALKAGMVKGVPIGQGNILRAAIQSPSGELVVLWTGTPPNGDGMQRPEILGHPNHGVFAPDQITASRWKVNPKAFYLYDGHPLCGLAVQLNSPVSGKVTLKVPILILDTRRPIRNSKGAIVGYKSKQVGVATVKDFPVIHTVPFSVLEFLRGNLQV